MTLRGRRRAARCAALVCLLALAGCVGGVDVGGTPTSSPTAPNPHPGYEQTTVRVLDDATGAELGRVTAAVADTPQLRYTGLSDTETLPPDRGMLFVYAEPQSLTYVMREMSFGIDIVYVAANGTITAIHHAPAPGPDEDGEAQRYPGYGQYVLEVNRRWTTDHDVTVGDRLAFELGE